MSQLSQYLKTQFNPSRPTSAILMLKKNKDGTLDELLEATSFLDEQYSEVTINQRLYHYINQIDYVLTCGYCGIPRAVKEKNARIISSHTNPKLQGHYITTCSNIECKKKHNLVKTEDGVMKKHGVKNISQTPQWREKVRATNLERRGVEWNTQSTDFLLAFKNASIKKYGVPHPKQSTNNFEKSHYHTFKLKEYIFPSGKKINVQGYEPQAIDQLLKIYSELDLIIGNRSIENKIGKIFYKYNGKSHRYYPDIFLIPENKIIEVKSAYTYNKNIEINLAKREACILAGFNFEFRII
jgi:hypothetical protein